MMTYTNESMGNSTQVPVFAEKKPRLFSRTTRFVAGVACVGLILFSIISWASSNPNEVLPSEEARITLPDSTSIIIPTPRPSLILMLPEAPAGIALPEPRPDKASLYPQTTASIEEAYEDFTGIRPATKSERFTLKSGEGLAELLGRGGLDAKTAQTAVNRISNHISLRSLPVGYEVTVMPSSKAHGSALRIALDDELDLMLIKTADGWRDEISIRPMETYLAYIDGQIDLSLYHASQDAGMDDNTFDTFVKVLSFSVDFQREIRNGDSFEALVRTKKDLITGETRGIPELLFLSMTLSGDRIEYYRHKHLDGNVAWYDSAGKSAARTLMRTPINGARLSSGYGKRKHPILGYSRVHRGVDFAAPTGTPVMAAGSGVIEFSGNNGNYGKYVRIRHNATYKTAYAHLSRIAVSRGTRVTQGQTIGYVGNTGLSTGPHLHYEILVNNREVNPMKVRLPSNQSIAADERRRFRVTMQSVADELQARGILLAEGSSDNK